VEEPIKIVLISSGFTLLGVLLGYIASAIQSKQFFNNQQEIEDKRREWNLEDRRLERKLSTLYRRLDNLELFIGYVNDDFHNLRHDIVFMMSCSDPILIEHRFAGYANWRDSIPRRIYSYGSAVRSLNSNELIKSWEKLYESFESMKDLYIKVLDIKLEDPLIDLGSEDEFDNIGDLWDEFNAGVGSFLAELDDIRSGSQIAEIDTST
jgi:hypothetical protein